VFLNLLGAAKGALIRAAASTQTLSRFALKTITQQRGVVMQLNGMSNGVSRARLRWVVLSFLNLTGARRARWLGAENPLQCRAG